MRTSPLLQVRDHVHLLSSYTYAPAAPLNRLWIVMPWYAPSLLIFSLHLTSQYRAGLLRLRAGSIGELYLLTLTGLTAAD
jgi:formate hydrogenlyase subunit 4